MTEKENTCSSKEIAAFQGLFALARDGRHYSSIKVQDIASAAGVGKGTLYEYFSSKEEIISRAVFYALEQLLGQLEQSMQEMTTLRCILEHFFDGLNDERVLPFAALSELIASVPLEQRKFLEEHSPPDKERTYRRLQQAEQQLLSAGRRTGEIDPALTDRFCEYVILSALFGQTAFCRFSRAKASDPAQRRMAVEMICRALRPQDNGG